MSKILFTLAEDKASTTQNNFAVKYHVDENDCLDFASGLKKLGHEIYFVNWDDLSYDLPYDLPYDRLHEQRHELNKQFSRMFDFNRSQFIEPIKLEAIDLIFVYKMEGFYFNLPRFYSMLDLFTQLEKIVINDVATIKHNIDKRYLWQLEKAGIKIIPTYTVDDVRHRIDEGETFVIKPIFGERGKEIFLAKSRQDLLPIKSSESLFLAQQYMREIRRGERSLVFLGKSYQHAVIKKPSEAEPEEFRCNESLGGTVAIYEPRQDELDYALDVLHKYESLGFATHFSRIDIIDTDDGPVLLEAELLNPSIYANYSGKGPEFGMKIAQYFDQLLGTRAEVALL